MSKLNQTQAAANIKSAIEANDQDTIHEMLEFLANSKRLSKEAKLAIEAGTEFLDFANEGDDEKAYSMSQHIAKYREAYQKTVAVSGSSSMNNGDDVAKALATLDHLQTCRLADEILGLHPGTKKRPGECTHEEHYMGLNNGQMRMNAGNRIRAAWKRGEVEVVDGRLQAS